MKFVIGHFVVVTTPEFLPEGGSRHIILTVSCLPCQWLAFERMMERCFFGDTRIFLIVYFLSLSEGRANELFPFSVEVSKDDFFAGSDQLCYQLLGPFNLKPK